ncbi:hypothetical protein F909_02844 [Acinetobacter sp. ANC 3929]|uniref:hypothetical protein n=1 Tax=Acinetobacter sp. ANC 3929 TaxID=1217707 RepID=UPI0002D12453|nr:hypothetical protein [Acinetobacter sp. ANC 3929]ENW79741.1 hypothetical protein F909_02844 [Acinetobacter sp. ANC 3929]
MKFKVEVSKTYTKDHIVEADDADHAKEIAKEISDLMPINHQTFYESTWDVTQVDDLNKVTYEPEQNYLK